jgi:hypothetical protein
MTFGERVVGAMKLEANAFEDVERDVTAMGQAVGVIALYAVSSGISWIRYNGLSGIATGIIAALIGYAVWAVIVWIVGTKVMPEPATKADFPETFRVVAFAAAPGLLCFIGIIPILGWLVGFAIWLWMIAAMVVAVRQVLDYSTTGKAIVVVIIGFIVNLVVGVILGIMFAGARIMSPM